MSLRYLLVFGLFSCALAVSSTGQAPDAKEAIASIYGQIVDPDRDSTFTIAGSALTIQMTARHHTLSTEPTHYNAPRVLKDVKNNFTATVRVEVSFPSDPESDLADLDPGAGAGLLLWIDEKNYVTFERLHEMLGKNLASSGTELHSVIRGESGGSHSSPPSPMNKKPVFLRLEKKGTKIQAAMSTDGEMWKSAGSIQFEARGKMKIGVFAGHNTGRLVTTTFDRFQVVDSD